MRSEDVQVAAATVKSKTMKRYISLFLLVCTVLTLCACTKQETIKPNTNVDMNDTGSAPVSEQKPSDSKQDDSPISTGNGFIDPNKKLNKGVMPTADIDKLSLSQAKTSELKGKTITFYTPERNSFSAGSLTEVEWFDKIADKFGVKLKYTVRPDSALFSSQAIAQKSGIKLDIITTLVSNTASSRTLMQTALTLDGTQTNLPFSKRVFDMSGGKILSGTGNAKMLWYNTSIVDDSKAYDYFAKDEWSNLTLDFIANDVRKSKKNMIECGNWAAFGSAAGTQVTGLTAEGTFVFAPESAASVESFKEFSEIFDSVSTKKSNFKNGGTAFCYTDEPSLENGSLGFVPIPGIYGKGKSVTELSGTGMGISSTVAETDKPFVLTFALLWASRYSEARTDALVYTYGLGASKAGRYIACAETDGALYNADRLISSYFDMSKLDKKLYESPETMGETFKAAYQRASVLSNRK